MKTVAVLQARTSSSRLPAKVLLPVQGVPLVVLAARRAANTGRDVIVATSTESSDDALVRVLNDAGVAVYRGSLEDTLERIVGAISEYDDDTLVFRLTADNVFPDGQLLDEMAQEFVLHKFQYLCCNGERSGLPYGMSVELMRARHLREANTSADSKYDREHVTPYIRRKFGEAYFELYKSLSKGHFRCTVDCFDDYQVIQSVFSDVQDPFAESSFDLIKKLDKAPFQPASNKPVRKMVLGAAQLGLFYGVANRTGKPDLATAQKIIKTAISNGVSYIDTARAYGDSEETIGAALDSGWKGRVKVVTKLSPLNEFPVKSDPIVAKGLVDASVFRSCSALRVQKLDVLLLHRAEHVKFCSGIIWKRLLELQDERVIGELGVSVQDPEELKTVLSIPEITFIQMPFNVLDWRWDSLISEIKNIKRQRNLQLHVRSSLLQGLLASKDESLWRKAGVTEPGAVINWLHSQSRDFSRANVADFCLAFVKSLGWVDGVVVGMESCEQLKLNIRSFCDSGFSEEQVEEIMLSRPKISEGALNPSRWSV